MNRTHVSQQQLLRCVVHDSILTLTQELTCSLTYLMIWMELTQHAFNTMASAHSQIGLLPSKLLLLLLWLIPLLLLLLNTAHHLRVNDTISYNLCPLCQLSDNCHIHKMDWSIAKLFWLHVSGSSPVCSGCLLNCRTVCILLIAITLLSMHATTLRGIGCMLNAVIALLWMHASVIWCWLQLTYAHSCNHIFSKLCMHMSRPRNLSFSQKFEGVQIYACHLISVRWCIACDCSFGLSAIRQSSYIFFTNGFLDPLSACIPSTNISNTVTVALHGNLSFVLQ